MAHKLIKPLVTAAIVGSELAWKYYSRSGSSSGPSVRLNSPNTTMAYPRYPPRARKYKKRLMKMSYRPQRMLPAPDRVNRIDSFKRVSTIVAFPLSAGAATQNFPIRLSDVVYSDLQGVYECYRIKRVTLRVMPQLDPGASASSSATGQCHVSAACDPTGATPVAYTPAYLSTIKNYKYSTIKGGEDFVYSFFPKAKNTMDNAGTAVAVGSYGKFNPWINLDATGPNIPHYNCMFGLQTGYTTSTCPYSYTVTIEFDCIRGR